MNKYCMNKFNGYTVKRCKKLPLLLHRAQAIVSETNEERQFFHVFLTITQKSQTSEEFPSQTGQSAAKHAI